MKPSFSMADAMEAVANNYRLPQRWKAIFDNFPQEEFLQCAEILRSEAVGDYGVICTAIQSVLDFRLPPQPHRITKRKISDSTHSRG
jgi:hypothetical protein